MACGIRANELHDARYETEYRFKGRAGPRIADLAVLVGDDEVPKVLIEIKYYDKPLAATETKPAQLEDYAKWQASEPHRYVLMLSREFHYSNGVAVRRWGQLARHLRTHSISSDLIAMLVDYLEEEGIVMQRVDPHKLLKYFKSLTFGHFGAGMMAKNIDGPAEFTKILRNLQLIASTFHHHFKSAWVSHNINTPTVDFKVHQRLKALKKGEKYAVNAHFLNNNLRDGGFIEAHARYSLGHGATFLRIRIGLCIHITGASIETSPPDTYLFVDAKGGSLNALDAEFRREKKIKYDHVTELAEVKTEYIDKHANALLLQLIETMRADKKAGLTNAQRDALKRLSRSIKTGKISA